MMQQRLALDECSPIELPVIMGMFESGPSYTAATNTQCGYGAFELWSVQMRNKFFGPILINSALSLSSYKWLVCNVVDGTALGPRHSRFLWASSTGLTWESVGNADSQVQPWIYDIRIHIVVIRSPGDS